MNKKTKEFLLKKEAEKWIEDNKGMIEDYREICHKILMFKMMWGIDIGIMLKTVEEEKGRSMGNII